MEELTLAIGSPRRPSTDGSPGQDGPATVPTRRVVVTMCAMGLLLISTVTMFAAGYDDQADTDQRVDTVECVTREQPRDGQGRNQPEVVCSIAPSR
ncbi:hypothetical protein BJY24_006849 [Nocardia transvalensis]|uniref:Uncharacterized protein n=1 Tax=Nocardia transvalensis TaxID=37333 RepID=A0A7W9PKY3_9NOCA|nr:hypothetical protein [Nocardia transvalensis]MBB5917937.1 hypothetical protein [Nocardia transvalensis]